MSTNTRNTKTQPEFVTGKLTEKFFYGQFLDWVCHIESDMTTSGYGTAKCIYHMNGNAEDREDGTDFLVHGLRDYANVRIDVTRNFSGKDFTREFKKLALMSNILNARIRFGIRTGNCHKKFTTPVIVVGFEPVDPEKPFDVLKTSSTKSFQLIMDRVNMLNLFVAEHPEKFA